MCRLDYFLIGKSLKGYNGYKSAHSLVLIELIDNYGKPGRGYWKFIVSLLCDFDMVTQWLSSNPS